MLLLSISMTPFRNSQSKISPSSSLGLWVVAICLIGLASVAFLVWSLEREKSNIISSREKLALIKVEKDELLSLRSLMGQLEVAESTLKPYFVTDQTLPFFIERLEQLATGLDLNFTMTAATINEEGPKTVVLRAQAGGSFANLQHFFSLLESLPHKVRLTQTVLRSEPIIEAEAHRWTANFVLELLSWDNDNE